jgi:hypothetical protein
MFIINHTGQTDVLNDILEIQGRKREVMGNKKMGYVPKVSLSKYFFVSPRDHLLPTPENHILNGGPCLFDCQECNDADKCRYI